ncbi:MAG: YggS family pyridoxal phosphate-dependent enzyme [Bacteroidota bacterium]
MGKLFFSKSILSIHNEFIQVPMAGSIVDNLKRVLENILEVVVGNGRKEEEVKLIAVSKTKPMDLIKEAFEAGQVDFGENKVQELREKHPLLPEANWHMIGSLQRNKVKYIAPFIYLIHSVDSERLLAEINKQGGKNERVISCLLQLNISDEDSKSGMEEVEAKAILSEIEKFPHVHIKGLMGMAAFTDDKEIIRSQFQRLAEARDTFKEFEGPQVNMEELSMGMSGDYDIAIDEGATLVRVGSAIFGSRNYG